MIFWISGFALNFENSNNPYWTMWLYLVNCPNWVSCCKNKIKMMYYLKQDDLHCLWSWLPWYLIPVINTLRFDMPSVEFFNDMRPLLGIVRWCELLRMFCQDSDLVLVEDILDLSTIKLAYDLNNKVEEGKIDAPLLTHMQMPWC